MQFFMQNAMVRVPGGCLNNILEALAKHCLMSSGLQVFVWRLRIPCHVRRICVVVDCGDVAGLPHGGHAFKCATGGRIDAAHSGPDTGWHGWWRRAFVLCKCVAWGRTPALHRG
uniref:Uncharacterized protein n=1 Tax=Eutreptiella gymnastica TaxID=73025 RepID=A0A7S4C7H1_9EUGL